MTSLNTTGEFGPEAQPSSDQHQHKMNDKDEKNPFTVPVAMLLYKMAKNMKNSTAKIQPKQAGSMKALLENCIKLLPKEKYPQIVASSFFLLCDLHIPTGFDPQSPKFENEVAESESVYDDENNHSDDSGGASIEDEHSIDDISIPRTRNDESKESDFGREREKNCSLPPPLVANVDERCQSALQYIVNGLNCLQYISKNETRISKAEQQQIEENQVYHSQHVQSNDKESKIENNVTEKHKEPPVLMKANQSITDVHSENALNPTHRMQWNVHLKILLLEKAALVYATLTEQAYQKREYGRTLKYIWLAIKCYHIVTKYASSFTSIGKNYYTNVLARAGDCYFSCAQNITDIDTFIEQYHMQRDIDLIFEKELHEEFTQYDEPEELQHLTRNVEQLILKSISSYEIALKFVASERDVNRDLLGRIGKQICF